MSQFIDETHDPHLQSWVETANDLLTDFPIQNLPLGVFRRAGSNERHRIGVAIGDQILDIKQCVADGLLADVSAETASAASGELLNQLMSAGRSAWREARREISRILARDSGQRAKPQAKGALVPMREAEMRLPCDIGDYSDFYASIHHATNVGSMFRPDNPLLPNYKYIPIGYHGRASSIVIDGTPIRRPMGQVRPDDSAPPIFGPVKLLDYEMEVGFFVGRGNALGDRIEMKEASEHMFGLVLVNDWSARDVQKWEYQPLGPFNAKNFGTTISPWVVTTDALGPFRLPGPPRGSDDPPPLDYLKPADDFAIDMNVEVSIRSAAMREKNVPAQTISRGNFRDMYWTLPQMLVHHTSTGCNLQPGDLIASGTVSNAAEDSRGCLLERTWRGEKPIRLPDGTERRFLQDGDEVIMRGWCERAGFRRIGFGECRGIVLPAT